MPNYHCSVSVIGRAAGRSCVAAAAYRSGEDLYDERQGLEHDYTRKGGVIYSEINKPLESPDAWLDRNTLWNEVEAIERSAKAQLAREVEVSLPRELSRDDQIALVRDYVQQSFVDRGMVADWSLHDKGDGNPHAHIMLTMRSCGSEGFLPKSYCAYLCRDSAGNDEWLTGAQLKSEEYEGFEKVFLYNKEQLTKTQAAERGYDPIQDRDRTQSVQATRYYNDWNNKEMVPKWREEWQEQQNAALERYYEREQVHEQLRQYVDCRSYADQGVVLIPQQHEGSYVTQIEREHEQQCLKRGQEYHPVTTVRQENLEIQEQNREYIRGIEQLRQRIQELKQAIASLRERILELARKRSVDHEGINQRIEATRSRNAELTGRVGELREQVEQRKQHFEEAERSPSITHEIGRTAQRLYAQARTNAGSLAEREQQERSRAESINKRLEPARAEAQSRIEGLEREKRSLTRQNTKLENKYTATTEQERSLGARNQELNGRRQELRRERGISRNRVYAAVQQLKHKMPLEQVREHVHAAKVDIRAIGQRMENRIRNEINMPRPTPSLADRAHQAQDVSRNQYYEAPYRERGRER